jgi:hypothetical protein
VVHFVHLTTIRRTANRTIAEVFALYDPTGRLTPTLAVDLAAWDFFLGFGLLFAGPIFKGDKLAVAIRASMTLSGLLCLVGVAGPASGDPCGFNILRRLRLCVSFCLSIVDDTIYSLQQVRRFSYVKNCIGNRRNGDVIGFASSE